MWFCPLNELINIYINIFLEWKKGISGAYFRQHRLEVQPLGLGEAVEDEEEVAVSIEGPGLDVQETDQVFEFDEVFTLEVDLLGRETFG